jgi:hypothetical protein
MNITITVDLVVKKIQKRHGACVRTTGAYAFMEIFSYSAVLLAL